MDDLNNLLYFAKIVEHGSLSAAAAALGVSKSVLSQHLSRLESDVGVRLIQRTTRKLHVTDVGQRYYQRCKAVLAEVARAGDVIDSARGTPRGCVRLTSPVNFAHGILGPLLADFLNTYPDVEVLLDITNREVDLIAEGYDLALRIAPEIASSGQIVRSLRLDRLVLVASRAFVEEHGAPKDPESLRSLPSVGGLHGHSRAGRHQWVLTGPDGTSRAIAHHPRLLTEDIFVLKQAVLAGCAIAELPRMCCRDELADGRMVQLLPDWNLPEMNLYAVFASRDGMTPALRCLIDYLAQQMDGVRESVVGGTLRLSLVPQFADALERAQ